MSYNNNKKTKPTWMSPPDSANGTNLKGYSVTSPWDKRGDEAIAEFERNLNATDYEYHSMFEVPELSAAKQKQIDEYSINPPFRCSYNTIEEPVKTQKKLAPGKNPPTRQPWTYGSLPPDPVPMKIMEKPPTALWSIPPEAKKEQKMESSGDPILDSLRSQLMSKGASGIAGLARKFKIMDDDGSGTLSMDEFRKGMRECELVDLSDKAVCHLFRYFDRDDSGFISYDEFLVGIRGVLNARRRGLVELAFKILDKDRSGCIDINDIKGVYNARSHPDVVTGKKTEQEVLKGFVESFEVGRNKDSVVTLEEFESYYANISASVDSDDYFELMIRNAWHISGGEGVYENTTNRRVLVTHADGRQSVEEVKDDIGIRANDKDAMIAKLKAQGLNVGTINTNGSAGMNNQHEAKDFYRTRVNAQQPEERSQQNSARGQLQPPNSARPTPQQEYSNTRVASGVRPTSVLGPSASGAQRLSAYVEDTNARSQPPPGRAAKPVRLGDLLAAEESKESYDSRGQRPATQGSRRW